MEKKTESNEELAKLAMSMYPGVMRGIEVWRLILLRISGVVCGFFACLMLLAVCKALWWVTFVWRY